jgi:transcriptional regulator with XRE-family HTH domain
MGGAWYKEEGGIMFKDNLIHTRKLLGMTQEDIAEKLGVTGQTIAKWESGDEGQGLALIKQEAFLAMAEMIRKI